MDYTKIENAVHDTLKADSWLGDADNVKTWEKGHRFFELADKEALLYFRIDELPGVAVHIDMESKRQEFNTTEELIETVTVEVQGVIRGDDRDPQAGQTASRTLVKNIERVMDAQKSSADNLGLTTECGYVTTTRTTRRIIKDGNNFIFLTTTEVVVETTTQF